MKVVVGGSSSCVYNDNIIWINVDYNINRRREIYTRSERGNCWRFLRILFDIIVTFSFNLQKYYVVKLLDLFSFPFFFLLFAFSFFFLLFLSFFFCLRLSLAFWLLFGSSSFGLQYRFSFLFSLIFICCSIRCYLSSLHFFYFSYFCFLLTFFCCTFDYDFFLSPISFSSSFKFPLFLRFTFPCIFNFLFSVCFPFSRFSPYFDFFSIFHTIPFLYLFFILSFIFSFVLLSYSYICLYYF